MSSYPEGVINAREVLDRAAPPFSKTVCVGQSWAAAVQAGVILSPVPVPVTVDDTVRSGADAITETRGLLLRQEASLVVYLPCRRETYLLVSPAGCRMWGTIPEGISRLVDAVDLVFSRDGSSYTKLYRRGVSLDECFSIHEFRAL